MGRSVSFAILARRLKEEERDGKELSPPGEQYERYGDLAQFSYSLYIRLSERRGLCLPA
jgi:hypothetical protein